jgi:hypothetical protein
MKLTQWHCEDFLRRLVREHLDRYEFIVVYYESRKRNLKRRLINEGRCDERLKVKVEETTRLTYTGVISCLLQFFFLKPFSPQDHLKNVNSGHLLRLRSQWENRWKKSEKKENEIEGLFWLYGYLGQKDAAWRCCLGTPNTFPVARKSWSSPVFRRVATGAGLRRCIGTEELQVWLHTLDYIFCDVCPLYAARTTAERAVVTLCHQQLSVIVWTSNFTLKGETNKVSWV